MFIRIFVFFFCLFNFSSLSAQHIYSKYAKGDMSKKQFIFTGLPEVKKGLKEKLNSKDSNNYEFWKEYLDEYWYLTDNYLVLPFEEAYALAKKNKKNTYLVQLGRLESSNYGSIYTLIRVMSPTSKKGQTAYSTILGYKVEPADIVYGLMNIQETLKNKKHYTTKYTPKSAAKKNGKMLKKKTLYIGSYKSKKERKKIEETYPYPYKFVTPEEINNAIINKEEGVLVIRKFKVSTLVNTPKSNFVVYSTSDGATVTHAIEKNICKAIKAFTKSIR